MAASDLLKKVRKIEIKTRGLSNHIFAGEYHSAFKGRGMTFSEVREYQPGDDVRSIDWNVTARFNNPFVKVFEEERELTVMLLVDVSGSQEFGTRTQFKIDLITELCAVIAFSAIQNNDKIGVLFFSDRIEKFISPKKGKQHILRIIRELIEFKPKSKGTNITQALQNFMSVIKKKSIAFLISDFMSPDFEDALKLVNRRHDLVTLRIYDKAETTLPDLGLVNVRDAETGKTIWLDSSDKKTRKMYETWWREKEEKLSKLFLRTGIDTVRISTGEPYVKPLINLFKKREKRI